MANRLNQQSLRLRLKDSIKREMSRTSKETLPLHCYAEVTKSLKDIIRYSRPSKSSFSYEDITKLQNNKYFEVSHNNLENNKFETYDEYYEEYVNSLTEGQCIIDNFNDYYDINNEEFYEKKLCPNIDKTSKEVSSCINNLTLSLSWFNEEIEKLNSKEIAKNNRENKNCFKQLAYLEKCKNIEHKYSAFWNKSITDLIHLYNEYSKNNFLEGIIHNLVVLSSLTKKENLRNLINEIIDQLYKKSSYMLNLNALNTLFVCSLIAKSLLIHNVGNVREFVMEKIINNNNLNMMFLSRCDNDFK